MLGTIVNAAAIAIGSVVGSFFRKGIPERFKMIVIHGLALCVLMLGANTTLANIMDEASLPLLFILSLVMGGLIGEGLDIDRRLESFGSRLQGMFGRGSDLSKGLVAASLLFCVGSMAVLGSLESGLKGAHDTLFAKSVLDGVGAAVFASIFGAGIILTAIPVFLYQGALTLFAASVAPYVTADLLREISIVGGILIFGIGLNLLEIKRIKIANLLPAMLIPVLYYLPFVQKGLLLLRRAIGG